MFGTALIALQIATAPVPAVSTEAEKLGRRLAETGTLATLLPIMEAKETAELVAAHPGLSAAEQAVLRRAAAASFAKGRTTVTTAMGQAYARSLTVAELRAMIVFNTGPLARRYRAAEPSAIAAAMQGMAGIDIKAEAWAAYCAATQRRCVAE